VAFVCAGGRHLSFCGGVDSGEVTSLALVANQRQQAGRVKD